MKTARFLMEAGRFFMAQILWHRSSNVGAGLLANAVGHSALMLTDTLLSRASPLPHLSGGAFEGVVCSQTHWLL